MDDPDAEDSGWQISRSREAISMGEGFLLSGLPFPSGSDIDSYTLAILAKTDHNTSEKTSTNKQRDHENLHYR